ncbi:unnamed protein product [Thlaspi arvense]|uniref:FHA domain-containing protein n=1 Tax=Thlaspi arvense TaxID=13288 RepID=A0AAU9SMW2_THLAR|nr:unnamed protein product [Thlaspi arvense]
MGISQRNTWAMEGEDEDEDEDNDHLGNKEVFDGYLEISGDDTAESPDGKRKVESGYGLFCVMRKRGCRHNDMFMGLDYAEKGDGNHIEVEQDDCFCSGSDSDTDLSECSEFDVISQEVVQDKDFIFLLSPDEVHEEDGVRSKEDVVLSSVSASPNDEIGLGISPIPLAKTFQGPNRPWSVCGSLDAGRNIPSLLGDASGASSSLDAQLSQTPSTLYKEEEVDGEDEISFSDVDAMIRRLNLIPDDSDSSLNREERNMSKHPRHILLGSEHCTRTSVPRGIMSQRAIAFLSCRDSKHFIRKHEVIIGRSYDGMNVDIDLGKDGYGSKISRRQALVKLEKNGSFSLKNLGKRHILVNGKKLNTGQIVSLTSCSSVNIRGIVFEFKINKEAVRQFLKNNTRRNSEEDTKFRWCE